MSGRSFAGERAAASPGWPAALLAAALLCPAVAHAGGRPQFGGELPVAIAGPLDQLDPALAASPAELLLAAQLGQPPLARGPGDQLVPVLLAELPRSEDGGKSFRLRLRPGLTFHDGSPITARALAATLARLGATQPRSPHAGLVFPLERTELLSETELLVHLRVPYPRWPQALAEPGAAVAGDSSHPSGAGPFELHARAPGGELHLTAFADHALGRPFLDALRITVFPDDRGARRAPPPGVPALGPAGPARLPGSQLLASYLFVGPARPDGAALRSALSRALDRKDLVRFFARGPTAPLSGLLPAPLGPEPPAAPPEAAGAPLSTGQLALLFAPSVEGHRAVAERIQLRLHDQGVSTRLVPLSGAELRSRTAGGAYDLCLAQLVLPAEPGLAGAAILSASGRQAEALAFLREVGAAGPGPKASRETAAARAAALLPGLPILPLYTAGVALGSAQGTALRGRVLREEGGPGSSPAPLVPVLDELWRAP